MCRRVRRKASNSSKLPRKSTSSIRHRTGSAASSSGRAEIPTLATSLTLISLFPTIVRGNDSAKVSNYPGFCLARKSRRDLSRWKGSCIGCLCEVHFPLFSFRPLVRIVLENTAVCSEVYGRFMGGSDRNRSNSGRLGQFVQHMQIAQGRINTGDCTPG